ncbi:MAG TPA: carboxypeptidase-like regulatory domain-containing protein, partial [Vicinamibacterales bacterium]
MCFLRRMLAAAILGIAVAGPADAQAVGQIAGMVTDRSGAVMSGVTVTVAGAGLQQPLTAVTGQNGTYTFPRVPIGTYSATFTLRGFKTVARTGINVAAGANATLDVTLDVASPLVDTKKTTTGGTFTTDQMLSIP